MCVLIDSPPVNEEEEDEGGWLLAGSFMVKRIRTEGSDAGGSGSSCLAQLSISNRCFAFCFSCSSALDSNNACWKEASASAWALFSCHGLR